MARRKIKTKKYKKMKIIDLVLFLISFLYFCFILGTFAKDYMFVPDFIWMIISNFGTYFRDVTSLIGFINLFLLMLVFIVVLFLLFILFSFPVNIICLFIKNRIKTKMNESMFFEENLDITYYRETFKDISPGEVSVVIDYEIEHKKDISAILMKLYLLKYIEFIDNKIVVKNSSYSNLSSSEKYVLEKLINNEYSTISSRRLYELSLNEAISHGFIEKKKDSKKIIIKLLCLLCLFVIFGFVEKSYDKSLAEFDKYAEIVESRYSAYDVEGVEEKEIFNEMLKDPDFTKSVFISIGLFASLLSAILKLFIPIYAIICFINYKFSPVKYKRTKSGNQLVELSQGLKKFINDFSKLSEKSKEEITLWEDFLVYAIILEENEKIIKDIMSYRKIENLNFIK